MKLPRLSELRKLNQVLRRTKGSNYLRILRVALLQYSRLSGDTRGLGFLRSRNYPGLYAWADSLVASKYATAELHFSANQVAALIRKYPWEPALIGLDPESTALETFYASERRCRRQNQWCRAVERHSSRWRERIERCKSFISYVLGESPDLEAIYNQCDFTAGASIGVHGNATNLKRKLSADRWSVTPSALPYFAAALCHNVHYATKVAKTNGVVQSLYISEQDVRETAELVDYNKVAFVPKTAKTHRSIAVEPLGNGYLQKGVDLEMRKRLKRIGINLEDQSLNQRMARQGSLLDGSDEAFCTIDLSSASDSVSLGLVKMLLPPDWFNFLDRIRSPSYKISDRAGGNPVRYEKFCSMGNGFCFPLETLIFAAICHSVKSGKPRLDYMVYGDDIIVRRKSFDDVMALLKRFGFTPNTKKTYKDGPFRESCGSNWYRGEDVTPFTMDFDLSELRSMFVALNQMRRNDFTKSFFERSVSYLIGKIPDQFRFFRPFKGPPDTGIDLSDLQFTPQWRRHQKWQCPMWLELHSRPKDDCGIPNANWVLMAAALRGHPSEHPFILRRQVEVRVRLVARSGELSTGTTNVWLTAKHPDFGSSAIS